MTNYLIKRLLLLVFTLFGICFLSFLVASLAPGDPAAIAAGMQIGSRGRGRTSDEVLKHTRRILYLDRPRILNTRPETRSSVVRRIALKAARAESDYERDDARGELVGEIGSAAVEPLLPLLDEVLREGLAELAARTRKVEALGAAIAKNDATLAPALAEVEHLFVPRGPRFGAQVPVLERARGWLEWATPRADEALDPARRLLEALTLIVPPEDGGPLPVSKEKIDRTGLESRLGTWRSWWTANGARYAPGSAREAAGRYLDAQAAELDARLAELRKTGSVAAPFLVDELGSSDVERRRRAAFALSLIVHKAWDLTATPEARQKLARDWELERKKIEDSKDKIDAAAYAREVAKLGEREPWVAAKLAREHKDQLVKWRSWWFRAEEQYVDFSTPRQLARAVTQTQFGNWMLRIARLDFGESFVKKRPVIDLILEKLPNTVFVNLWSFLLIYLFALPIGIYSATHPNTVTDRVSTVTLFLLYSLPSFWVGAILILLFTGPPGVDWFPTHGLESLEAWKLSGWALFKDKLLHYCLPVLTLTYGGIAYISRTMRAGMLEVIRQDYIRTARAKGLSDRVVVYKHALRNSLIPVLTLLADLLPWMFGGSVIVESIFSIDGIGRLMFEAIPNNDIPIVMADVFISGVLTLFGILISDLSYALVDPRIQFE